MFQRVGNAVEGMHAHHRTRLSALLAVAGLALVAGACGDDDNAAPASSSSSSTSSAVSTSAEPADFCTAAEALATAEDPTADQVAAYVAAAPAAIAAPAAKLDALYEQHELGSVEHFVARSDDAVEDAFRALTAFETDECGIDNTGLAADTAPDPEAARVDVVATDFSFALAPTLPAGRTSFVLTNDGAEAHELIVVRLGAGHTFEEAMAFEGDPVEAGLVEDQRSSGYAAPGGRDEEFVTIDLAPGSYAVACFLPTHDGTPHAMLGMVSPFTVG